MKQHLSKEKKTEITRRRATRCEMTPTTDTHQFHEQLPHIRCTLQSIDNAKAYKTSETHAFYTWFSRQKAHFT